MSSAARSTRAERPRVMVKDRGHRTALARVASVCDAVRPHNAYLFANRRANRMAVLVLRREAKTESSCRCVRTVVTPAASISRIATTLGSWPTFRSQSHDPGFAATLVAR